MQCVINLTCQFFTVYLLLWLFITLKEWTNNQIEFPRLHASVDAARATVQFCPMLAVLFVGTRMRALQLSNNRGAPQGWTQDGMYMATWAILLQFLMVLLIPVCTYVMEGKAHHPELDEDGNVKWNPSGKIALIVVQVIRWIGFVLLYAGTVTVMIGICTMTPENANG